MIVVCLGPILISFCRSGSRLTMDRQLAARRTPPLLERECLVHCHGASPVHAFLVVLKVQQQMVLKHSSNCRQGISHGMKTVPLTSRLTTCTSSFSFLNQAMTRSSSTTTEQSTMLKRQPKDYQCWIRRKTGNKCLKHWEAQDRWGVL